MNAHLPKRQSLRLSAIPAAALAVASGLLLAQSERAQIETVQEFQFPSDVQLPEITQGFGPGPRPHAHFDRHGVPDWEPPAHMAEDVFTFVRVIYDSDGGGWGRRGGGDKWRTDYPDSDLNFSYRLQELTSLEVDPDGRTVELTDPELFDYPFIYLIEPGNISLSQLEAETLRKYLLNGGFLMVDDFWGDEEWEGFYRGLKQVFPDREPKELPLDHEIFHCVFDLTEKVQVPSIDWALLGRARGTTFEANKPGSETVQYKGIFDDKGRLMCIICFNTDLGDGWEREGESQWYFKEFSEKKAYPMGINIVFYALTH
jgi:hypothetical protein